MNRPRAYVPNNPLNEVLTPNEAAAMLGMTERHVRYLCAKGEIIARKAGASWLILRSSVEARTPVH